MSMKGAKHNEEVVAAVGADDALDDVVVGSRDRRERAPKRAKAPRGVLQRIVQQVEE